MCFYMVGAENFEISTYRLKAGYSASELRTLMFSCLRKALLDLRCVPAFLNNAKATKRLRSLAICFRFIVFSLKNVVVESRGIEPRTLTCKASAFPITP